MAMRLFPALAFLSLFLAACAGAPAALESRVASRAAEAHAARIAHIVSSWEAAGGSRTSPPRLATIGGEQAVSAAWWGWDPTDATNALQAAVDSGASTVVVPRMPGPWILSRTLDLRTGGIRLLLEPGVVLLAAAGAFRGGGDCLIEANGAADFSVVGYGATLRMRKEDYQKPPYEPGQWRHTMSLRGVARARIAGLSIESSGGDGVYVGVLRAEGARLPCEDVALEDLDIGDNLRQGVSVISARRLLVAGCRISGSSGAKPMAGIDFEPNSNDPGFQDCVVRDCVIQGNAGVGILFVLSRLGPQSAPVSIRVEDCVVNNPPLAVWLHGLGNGVRGTLTLAGTSFRGLAFLFGSPEFSVVHETPR
jgi:hypothetical protein